VTYWLKEMLKTCKWEEPEVFKEAVEMGILK
jgi:hypothetical protein